MIDGIEGRTAPSRPTERDYILNRFQEKNSYLRQHVHCTSGSIGCACVLGVWNRVDVGAHHAHFIVFLVQVMQQDVA